MIYKAVIFDAGGVLHPDMSEAIKSDVKTELGLTKDQATEFWDLVMNTLGVGKISEAEFWPIVTKQFGLRTIRPEENLLGRVYEKRLTVRHELLDLARELSGIGIKTSVLSDTIESHAKAQTATGQYKPFDEIFLSNEVHIRKPGQKIYEIALEKLGVRAEETIFIDDREINLESPRRMGMRTILFESQEKLIEEIHALCFPVTTDSPWVSLTFLARPDGALLLQHRDNKPNIASPGAISAWGGRGNAGETPFECAFRELKEETSLRPNPNDLAFIDHYQLDHEERDFWAFELKQVDDKSLKVFEGQGFVVLKDQKQADALPVISLVKQIIKEHSLL